MTAAEAKRRGLKLFRIRLFNGQRFVMTAPSEAALVRLIRRSPQLRSMVVSYATQKAPKRRRVRR